MKSDVPALSAGVIAIALMLYIDPGKYEPLEAILGFSLGLVFVGYVFGQERSPIQRAAVASLFALAILPLVAYIVEIWLPGNIPSEGYFAAWLVVGVPAYIIDWAMSRR
jgi:hypothetical protein